MKSSLPLAILAVALAGCSKPGDLVEGGISAVRSLCPTVSIPAGTGDVTLFDPPASQEATAIDVVATLTNVRTTCDDSGAEIVTRVTFDVQARRNNTAAAREVTLPYFLAVVRGGNAVTAKRTGQVTLRFEAGQPRAATSGEATAVVSRAAVTLPEDVRERITRKRKAGDVDAAIDPLSQPEVRQAVLSATFEALVGFQLTADQLRYNATR